MYHTNLVGTIHVEYKLAQLHATAVVIFPIIYLFLIMTKNFCTDNDGDVQIRENFRNGVYTVVSKISIQDASIYHSFYHLKYVAASYLKLLFKLYFYC